MLLSPALQSRSSFFPRFGLPNAPSNKTSLAWKLSYPPFVTYGKKLRRWSSPLLPFSRRIAERDTRRRSIVAVVALSLVECGTPGNGPKAVDHATEAVSPMTGSIRIGAGANSISGNGSFSVGLPVLSQQIAGNQVLPLLPEEKACLQSAERKASFDTLTKEQAEISIVEAEKIRRKKISVANKGRVPWNKGRRFLQGTLPSPGSTVLVETLRDTDDNTRLLEREKLRRQRISRANKGKTAWNKGRRHPEETRLRIKARTLEAMKDPKVREKLRLHGEKQSPKTRLKISTSLSYVWKVKSRLKQIQETCIKEWKEMIAEVARVGDDGDVVYQWNSYRTIMKELRDAWKLSLKEVRNRERKISRSRFRIPSSVDRKTKISEAITAKWADPSYRLNVQQGIRAHLLRRGVQSRQRKVKSILKGTTCTNPEEKKLHMVLSDDVGSEEKSSFAEASDTESGTSQSKSAQVLPAYRDPLTHDTESGASQFKPEKVLPAYRDPLTHERLKKLKRIRASRLYEEARRREVTERARILIAEAERAAKALEVAAAKDKKALAPLLETRRLLAEAAQSFETAGFGKDAPLDSSTCEGSKERWKTDATI